MKNKRIVTYSLLAHINNTGTISKGLLEIFIPLAKRAISILNNEGIFSGKNISEIQKKINDLYGIDIPTPVLKNILMKISEEVNSESNTNFTLFNDGAYSIKNYVFTEFDLIIKQKIKEVEEIEELFKQFCDTSEISKKEYNSIFKFLEKNKIQVSKYLNENYINSNGNDFSIEAQFIDFFKKIPPIYERIKDLYLGTIISTYIEYSSPKLDSNVELLFDTNFLISLIDLNTPESTHSCRKLISIAKQNGYKLSVLKDTIEETERLLHRRSETFNEHFLTKKINPEDIFNACDRRKLTKTDLESIADSLKNTLTNDFGIYIIPNTEKYKNIAKFSKEYISLKEYRNNDVAALHDAIAIHYVREKRENKKIKSFDRVPCWFVNNAVNNFFQDEDSLEKQQKNDYQPEIIKVDILLNILWLSNPNNGGSNRKDDISDTGLACLVSSTLIESMPKNTIIKELDDNITKYASTDLTPEQVVRVATRIANKQITDLECINNLAKEDKEKFIKRLQLESDKQLEIENKRIAQIENILTELSKEADRLKQKNKSNEVFEKENLDLKLRLSKSEQKQGEFEVQINELKIRDKIRENKYRNEKRDLFINNEISKWRKKSWIELAISFSVFITAGFFLLEKTEWNFIETDKIVENLKANFIVSSIFTFLSFVFSIFVLNGLYGKYRNYSNINAFKSNIKIPEEFKELP